MEGCIFRFLHPENCFQKSAFSVAAFSGSMWAVGQYDAIRVRFRKRVFSCGRLHSVAVTSDGLCHHSGTNSGVFLFSIRLSFLKQ